MKVINLRDIYPHYTQDCFVEVTDEVADLFSEFDHKEAAYRLRTYRHKTYYSLVRFFSLHFLRMSCMSVR